MPEEVQEQLDRIEDKIDTLRNLEEEPQQPPRAVTIGATLGTTEEQP